MPARKIVFEDEVVRWFAEGRTYDWMTAEYLRKYDVEISQSAWGNFRRRRGLDRRITRADDLIPWGVRAEHRWLYPVLMLRAEARRRDGRPLSLKTTREVDRWLSRLRRDDLVVDYDPETLEGWAYVARREGIDTDIIRAVERPTTRRRNADRPDRGVRADARRP